MNEPIVPWGRLSVSLSFLSLACLAQVPADQPGASKPSYTRPVASITKALLRDQKRIWSSPARLRPQELIWLAPLAGTTVYLLASDERNMTERFHSNPQARDRAALASNLSLGGLAVVPAYLYWFGWRHSDEYAQETALLSARAAAGALIAAQAIHLITWRERPRATSGAGRFYHSSSLSSGFPSMHAAAAWAMAPILAERYPGWLTELAVYGLAGTATLCG